MVMHGYRAATLESPSFLPLSIIGCSIPLGQALNNTHDLLYSTCKILSFSSVSVITPL